MVRSLPAAMLAFLILATGPAGAAAPVIEPKTPRPLTDDDMAEIVDFVVGNAVFALYHQAGHMLMQRYGAVPKGIGNAERAADLFAVTTLLDPRSGAGDQTIIDAIDSFKLATPDTLSIADPGGGPSPHAIDARRADAITCDIVGADPEGFSDIAEAARLGRTARRACAATWQRDRAAWTAALKAVPRPAATPAAWPVDYAEAEDADTAAATMLEDNGVLEEVGERLAARFALAEPLTLEARNCGKATTRYDDRANGLVLCYELATVHQHRIMRDIERRD